MTKMNSIGNSFFILPGSGKDHNEVQGNFFTFFQTVLRTKKEEHNIDHRVRRLG
jgi:hypothetical protein